MRLSPAQVSSDTQGINSCNSNLSDYHKLMIYITSYDNPDLDGIASMYAYGELLNKLGQRAKAIYCGVPVAEAEFVIEKLALNVGRSEEELIQAEQIIILDTSDPDMVCKGVDPAKVIEVIDHRTFHSVGGFPSAKAQIEPVGACATLIAERFKLHNIIPSETSATALYSAIVSNTINFKANVTTDRDKQMAQWMKSISNHEDELVREMFEYKSTFDGTIKEWFMRDYKRLNISGNVVAIIQHEIINVADFVKDNIAEIKKALDEIYHEYKYDYLFLSCIDIVEGCNEMVCVDEKTKILVEQAIGIKFIDCVAKTDHVKMRKEIIPQIKKILEA